MLGNFLLSVIQLQKLMLLVPRLCLEQASEARKLFSASSPACVCPAGKICTKQHPVKLKHWGKTGQLSCLLSCLSQQATSKGCLHESSPSLLPEQFCI